MLIKAPLPPYQKDPIHEAQLRELNELLYSLQEKISEGLDVPHRVSIFLVGTPRCGHTLTGQLMISRFRLAYPTNFVARFWRAPGVGARIQRLVVEAVSAGLPSDKTDYVSEHGATRGLKDLHEFSYFWQEIFNFGETHALSEEEWNRVDTKKLLRLIASLEHEFGDIPVLFKNGQLGFQVARLAKILPRAVFICCQRNPLYVAQSIVLMREKRFGNRNTWFGFRPPEYPRLINLPWWEQIAAQVMFIRKHLHRQFKKIEKNRTLILNYEDVCASPEKAMEKVAKLVEHQGDSLEIIGDIPKSFVCRNIPQLSSDDLNRLQAALTKFSKIEIEDI